MQYDVSEMDRRWDGFAIRPTTSGIMQYNVNETSRRLLHGGLNLAETQENEGPWKTPRSPFQDTMKTSRRHHQDPAKTHEKHQKNQQNTLERMSDEANVCRFALDSLGGQSVIKGRVGGVGVLAMTGSAFARAPVRCLWRCLPPTRAWSGDQRQVHIDCLISANHLPLARS